MVALNRRLSDQEIRSVLLQARARRQSRTFNDVLAHWGQSVGWQGYEADIARARTIFAEGPDAWAHPTVTGSLEMDARLFGFVPRANQGTNGAATAVAEATARVAPVAEAISGAVTEPVAQLGLSHSESSEPRRATASAAQRPNEIPPILWFLLGALGLAIAAAIIFRLLRSR